MARAIHEHTERDQSDNNDDVENARDPLTVHETNHGKRSDAECAGGAQDKGKNALGGFPRGAGFSDVAPGLEAGLLFIHCNFLFSSALAVWQKSL